MCVLIITQLFRLVGRLGSRKHVLPYQFGGCRYSNRPKSIHNRCVIDVFGGAFVFPCYFLELSVGLPGTESYLLLFLLVCGAKCIYKEMKTKV